MKECISLTSVLFCLCFCQYVYWYGFNSHVNISKGLHGFYTTQYLGTIDYDMFFDCHHTFVLTYCKCYKALSRV